MVLAQGPDFEKHYFKTMRERYFIKSTSHPPNPGSYGFDSKFVLREYYVYRKCGCVVCMCVHVHLHTMCLYNSVNKEGIIPKSLDSES